MGKTHSRRSVIVGASASAVVLTPLSLVARPSIVHEVSIRSFTFEPALIQVHIGDTIRWTNHDLAPHTATADEFEWDTGEIMRDGFADIAVSADMETSYFCAFHPHMKGGIDILRGRPEP